MAGNISNIMYSKIRFTGMASGLDTDSIVQQLMRVERMKVDRIKQDRERLEWKRDNYREISNLLRSFQEEFFNSLKPLSNMRSMSLYSSYNVSSTNPSVATATGGTGVTGANHTIEVLELAKAASGSSTVAITKSLEGSAVGSFNIDGYNRTFTITYNGVSKNIIIPDGSYTDAASVLGNGLDGKLKQLVDQAFNGNVTVSEAGGKLRFSTANASDTLVITTKISTGDNMLGTLALNSLGEGSTLNFSSPLQIKKGMKFELTLVEGGVPSTKVIQWDTDKSYNNINELVSDLQAKVDSALGAPGKITVSGTDNKLKFEKGAGVDSFTLSNSDILKDLGFQSGDSNKLSLGDTMEKVSSKLLNGSINFDANGNAKLTINSVDIEFSKTDTLSSLISKVNSSAAGVNLSYSAHSDTFTITAKEPGAGTITLEDNGSNFFTAISLTSANITAGNDASFKLDGISGNRKTNTFTVDGVSYNLLSLGTTEIKLTQNADEVFNKIKAFVDKYNEVIGKINGELSEKYDRNYLPLTEEQKAAMKEEDIKKWEEKAKTGLLSNDSLLNKIVSDMRKAMYDAIDGVEGGLISIGIKTGPYYDKGKLVIDEAKLKEAITNSPDKVANIFAKESSISYYDVINGAGSRADRYKENGIVNRLYDILQDSIRTTRDKEGKKGLLLEKAGIAGDFTEFKNIISEEINRKNEQIDDLLDKMYDKEDRYYKQFAALEKAMSQMNSQSAWLAQQFGSTL